jgi:hypothetical protein
MGDLIQQLKDVIAASKPSNETLWVWIAASAIIAGLSYWVDNTGTFTIPGLIGAAAFAAMNYATSKSRHEETKAIQAAADAKVAAIVTPPAGTTNF